MRRSSNPLLANLRPALRLVSAAAIAVVLGCQPPSPSPNERPARIVTGAHDALRQVNPVVLRQFVDGGDLSSLETALERNLNWLEGRSDDEVLVFGPRTVTPGLLAKSQRRVLEWLREGLPPEALAARLESEFDVFVNVADGASNMLITGYYEPLIDGSLKRTDEYPVPVYGMPTDIVSVSLGDFTEELEGKSIKGRLQGRKLVPYPDRRAIRQSRELSGLEIAWARDPVDLFFVEVQGSGALVLPDGSEVRIGYAGSNGRSYRSIGKLLIDEGAVPREQMSMQAIRSYLEAHPEEIRRVLDHNTSQVFFRRLNGPPVGSLGQPVTPERSIAADPSFLPRGALAFLRTEEPARAKNGETVSAGPLHRFVLNQDTGGAIKGAARADFFWGRGEAAAHKAGLMKQQGRLYFLVPKS